MNHLNKFFKILLAFVMLALLLVTPLSANAFEITEGQIYEDVYDDDNYIFDDDFVSDDDGLELDNNELESDEDEEEELELEENLVETLDATTNQITLDITLNGFINARGIPLRSGPGTSYSSIRSLAINTDVVIFGQSANGNWTQVRVGSQTGWVNSSRVTHIAPNGQINARGIPLRSGPGTSHSSIRSLAINTNVAILGQSANGNWTQVRVGNQTGWVNSSRITRIVTNGQINARGIPLRSGPGTSHSSIRSLAINTNIAILGESANGNWIRVRVGNQYGWVSSSRITRVTPSGRINARGIPLRNGSGTSYSSIRSLAINTNVAVLGQSVNGNWTRVQVGNQYGWVNSSRINLPTLNGRINARGIPLRSGPGTRYSTIRSLAINTNVVILGQSANGNWTQVQVGNQTGWVSTTRITTMLDDIEATLQRMVAGRRNIGISYFCLTTGRHISINGNRSFFAASTMKLPTHMMVAEAVQAGTLSWNQRLTVRQGDITGGSGILQNSVRVGNQFTLYELMRHSIVYSDNIGHRMVTRAVMPNFVPGTMDLTNAVFNRYLPGQRPGARMNLTPNQLTEIFRVLYRDRNSIEGYGIILDYMMNTSWTNRFYTSLTRGRMAHTPGWIGSYSHDSGIFFTDNPYVLVVMTDGAGGARFLSDVADAVFRIHRQFE